VRIAAILSTGTDLKKKPEYEQMTTFAKGVHVGAWGLQVAVGADDKQLRQ
jgi:hypothetical protein